MSWLWLTLSLAHLLGLALGVGAATVKLVLLIRCNRAPALVAGYVSVTRPITRLIVLGLILLTVSGVGWMLLGQPWQSLLIMKLTLVGGIWVIGPIIDKVFEPKFEAHAPAPGASVSAEFSRIQKQHLALEALATTLFYAAAAMGALL